MFRTMAVASDGDNPSAKLPVQAQNVPRRCQVCQAVCGAAAADIGNRREPRRKNPLSWRDQGDGIKLDKFPFIETGVRTKSWTKYKGPDFVCIQQDSFHPEKF